MYLIIGEVDGHIKEKNESKYLVFDSAGENRKVLKKYIELWDEIKNEIETINGDKNDEYGKDCGKLIFSLNIYYIKHIPTKNLVHVDDGRDYLYLFLDDVDGYIEENNGIKHLVFTPTEKNKEALKNYEKLWEETKKQIEVINDDEPIKYRKDFMKIRFQSDNDLPLGKTFSISHMIIVAASVLEKNVKFYP